MILDIEKTFYNKVISQTSSETGHVLFAGNSFGDIFILNLERLISFCSESRTSATKPQPGPVSVFSIGDKVPVNSLVFYRNVLIIGTVGVVVGYTWNEDKQQIGEKCWEVPVPTIKDRVEVSDVNSLRLNRASAKLYAGCGDHMIYQIDISEVKINRSFSGHKDLIHCIAIYDDNLCSASEDGTINFWDTRTWSKTGFLEPYKDSNVARPEFGKWQGTVSVSNDWVVCGGGPKAAIYHLRSLECTNVMSFPEKVHCSDFVEDFISIAGEHNCLQQYSYNADIVAEVPISGASAYSVLFETTPPKLISVGGASNFLDILTAFNYRDMAVQLYGNKS